MMRYTRNIFLIFLALVILTSGMYGAWRGWQYFKIKKQYTEDDKAIEILTTYFSVPDEVPQVITVTDKDKLYNEPFFKQAENNDKIIVYVEAKKAYLYRPSLKKILDVTTINLVDPIPYGPQ